MTSAYGFRSHDDTLGQEVIVQALRASISAGLSARATTGVPVRAPHLNAPGQRLSTNHLPGRSRERERVGRSGVETIAEEAMDSPKIACPRRLARGLQEEAPRRLAVPPP